MKKFIYTFILVLASFQFTQAQEILGIFVVQNNQLHYFDSVDYGSRTTDFMQGGVMLGGINTGSSEINVGDSIRISFSVNGEAYVTLTYASSRVVGVDSVFTTPIFNMPFYLSFMQNGENILCADVSYVVSGGVKTLITDDDPYCAPFYITLSTSLTDIDILKDVSLYPNPVSNQLKINNLTEITDINVYSITGQLVKTVSAATGSVDIDVANLSSGIYIVKMQSGKNIRTEKIQVVR